MSKIAKPIQTKNSIHSLSSSLQHISAASYDFVLDSEGVIDKNHMASVYYCLLTSRDRAALLMLTEASEMLVEA